MSIAGKVIVAVAVAAVTAGNGFSQTATEQLTVDKDWFEFEVRWTEGAPSYYAKWRISGNSQKALLCGLGVFKGNRSQTRAVLKSLGFYADDELILTDMSFFGVAKSRKDLVGGEANCVAFKPDRRLMDAKAVSLRSTKPGKVYRE